MVLEILRSSLKEQVKDQEAVGSISGSGFRVWGAWMGLLIAKRPVGGVVIESTLGSCRANFPASDFQNCYSVPRSLAWLL